MLIRKITCTCIMLFIFSGLAVAQEESAVRIIVNKANIIPSVNMDILKKIFLGKRAMWPDDKPIILVAMKEGDIHKKFLELVVSMNNMQFETYWKKAQFTGTGVAPQVFDSEEDVKKFIAEHPEAIGYISQAALDESVKRIPIK